MHSDSPISSACQRHGARPESTFGHLFGSPRMLQYQDIIVIAVAAAAAGKPERHTPSLDKALGRTAAAGSRFATPVAIIFVCGVSNGRACTKAMPFSAKHVGQDARWRGWLRQGRQLHEPWTLNHDWGTPHSIPPLAQCKAGAKYWPPTWHQFPHCCHVGIPQRRRHLWHRLVVEGDCSRPGQREHFTMAAARPRTQVLLLTGRATCMWRAGRGTHP